MKPSYFLNLMSVTAALIFSSPIFAAGSMLRVTCEEDEKGAEVRVDGKFRGECPVDIVVTEGTHRLQVIMPTGRDEEKKFEQIVRIGADSVKKIAVEELDIGRTDKARQKDLLIFKRTLMRANQGDTSAMNELVIIYSDEEENGVENSPKQALHWLMKSANAGNVFGIDFICGAYAFGNYGVEINEERAAPWCIKSMSGLRRKAEAGDLEAMKILFISLKGDQPGVPKDLMEAEVWKNKFKEIALKGAERGNFNNINDLVWFYEQETMVDGKEVESENAAEARKQHDFWEGQYEPALRKASQRGDSLAMYTLAQYIEYSEDGWSDEELKREYMALYRKAAAKGNPKAIDEVHLNDQLIKLGFRE